MEKEIGKLNKTASSLGFDLALFPGIPIAAIPLYFIFNGYKNSLFDFFGLDFLSGYQQIIINLILTLISSIIIYKISGWCLDWMYDKFYYEKKNPKSELNEYIISARKEWIKKNRIYKNEIVGIYKPTIETVEIENELEYKKIKENLSISKLFRILVIPMLILGYLKMTNEHILLGVVCIAIAIVCLFISFNYRAEHSKRLYRWFISSS